MRFFGSAVYTNQLLKFLKKRTMLVQCCEVYGPTLKEAWKMVKKLQTPPYFQPGDSEAFAQWLSHGVGMPGRGEETMTPPVRELLEAWALLSKKGEPFDILELHESIQEITGKERALSTTQRRVSIACSQLAEAGVAWRERANDILGPGHRRALIYTLRSPAILARDWQGAPNHSQDNPNILSKQEIEAGVKISELAERTYDHLKTIGWLDRSVMETQKLPSRTVDDAWTLHLISQLIERCSKSSPRERIDTLNSHIWINGEMIEVEASRVHFRKEAGAEYGLIAAEDSQLILAIITMAMQSIARDLKSGRGTPKNRISFDLLELSRELHPAGGRAAYYAFQRGMARIINTVFRINRVGESGKHRLTFRLLNDVTEGEDAKVDCESELWEPNSSNMRYFHFSLNAHIWNGLLRRQGWLVHPELVYERSGIIHRVYHHLRTHTNSGRPYKVEAEDLAKWLVSGQGSNPTRSRLRFRQDLKAQLLQRARRTRYLTGETLLGEANKPKDPSGVISVKLFDLDVRLRPCCGAAENFILEAKQSKETLELMRRQEELHQEIMELSEDQGLLLAGPDW